MKRFYLMIGLALLTSAAMAMQKAIPIQKVYKPEQVADNVYVIHGPVGFPSPENQGFMNNPAFIVGDKGVVVVDPGGSVQIGEMVLARIAEITDKPVVAVFNSHIHGDHWLGNDAIRSKYPNVPIYGLENVGPKIIGGKGTQWIQLMLSRTKNATAGTKVVAVDHPVKNGDVIKAAGLTFEVFNNGKAHTDTDIMVLVKERGVMFLGDNAGNGRVMRLENGSYRGGVEAMDIAMKTGATIFVPGHGLTGGKEVPQSYRKYLSTIWEVVEAGYNDGKDDFEIRPALEKKLQHWAKWDGFEQGLGGHISRAYLEVEAASFE